MKQWKFLLSSAIAIGGIALYQTHVYSSTTPIEKVALKSETGDSAAMKDLVLSGMDSEERIFTLLNNQLKLNEDASWLKRQDLPLAQGDPRLEKILDKNDDFFRGANEYSPYVVGEDYAVIFYTTYKDNTTTLYMNTYDQKANKAATVNLVPESSEYHDVIDAYVKGDTAYVATSSVKYEEYSGKEERKVIFRKVNLKDGKAEIISDLSQKASNAMLEAGANVDDNSPYLLLHEESDDGSSYTLHFIDLRTGESLAAHKYNYEKTSPYFIRDDQNIYRFFVTGALDDLTVKVEQAAVGENEVNYKELSTLEHVPFAVETGEMMPVDPAAEPDNINAEEPLSHFLFSSYQPAIMEGRLYLIPAVIEKEDKQKTYYVFDLGSGKLVASGAIEADIKSEGTNLNFFHLQKVNK